MMKSVLFVLLCTFFSDLNAGQLYCPEDIIKSCMSETSLEECGYATLQGNLYPQHLLKFVDDNRLSSCNEGVIYRTFFVDVDEDGIPGAEELQCTQTITLIYSPQPLNIVWPSDITLSCIDDVPLESPTWDVHECGIITYNHDDQILTAEQGSCFKVRRTFKVINWCRHNPATGEGEYSHVQVIKVVDTDQPEFNQCADVFEPALANCVADVDLINSAFDTGVCPTDGLTWWAEVDFFSDNKDPVFFGPDEPIDFRTFPVSNNEDMVIDFPTPVEIGVHKVKWTVRDGCGNVKSCNSILTVADTKAPTPYCYVFTTAALDGSNGGTVPLPADLFMIKAEDNCTPEENINISFSEDINDTLKVIGCGDAGFQFFRIYVTDENGNNEFCEVFMVVFDNGSCLGQFSPGGRVTSPLGSPLEGITAYFMDDQNTLAEVNTDNNGSYNFGIHGLYETHYSKIGEMDRSLNNIDVSDYLILRDALLGKYTLSPIQKRIANLNGDHKIDIRDLKLFRDFFQKGQEYESIGTWEFIPTIENIAELPLEENHSSTISYTDYNMGFDYIGICKGDLSSGNEIQNDSRAVHMELHLSDDSVEILNAESLNLKGLEMNSSIVLDVNIKGEHSSSLVLDNIESIEQGELRLSLDDKGMSSDEILSQLNLKLFANKDYNQTKVQWSIFDHRTSSERPLNEKSELSVYPNPFDDRIVLSERITEYSIIGLDGSRLDGSTMSTGDVPSETVIETSSFLPGFYLLIVKDIQGNTKTFKLIK